MTDIVAYNPKKWCELNYRDKAAYLTAYGSFVLGWTIAFVGLFLPPVGYINPTVVTMAGTGLVFTGSVLGLNIWVKGTKAEIITDVTEKIQERIQEKLKEKEKEEQ